MASTYDGKPEKYDHLIQNGYEFRLGEYVSRGWEIFKMDPGAFMGFTLLLIAINIGLGLIPFVGSIANLFISPCLAAGMYIVGHRYSTGQPVEFRDFFKGFEDIVQLGVGSLVYGIFIMLGMLLLIFPGIYLAVAYGFVVPLIVFARIEFWPSMELSRKIITKHWWNFFLLGIVCSGIALLGFLALGIGIIAAIPVISLTYYAAFEDIVLKSTGGMDSLIDEIGDEPSSSAQADPYTGDF